jgi:hypothetical protein
MLMHRTSYPLIQQCIFVELQKTTEFYPLPACQVFLLGGTRYITSCEQCTITTELPEYDLWAHIQQRASIRRTTSMISSAGLPTDQPL